VQGRTRRRNNDTRENKETIYQPDIIWHDRGRGLEKVKTTGVRDQHVSCLQKQRQTDLPDQQQEADLL
jgi:hypothetical protein